MTDKPGNDKVISRMFSWCELGQHSECKRGYQRYMIDPKTNKVVWLEERVVCSCKKRGCKCYVKPADRAPVKKTRKPRRKP